MMAMIGGPRTEPGSIAYLDKHLVHWAEHGFGFWMVRHTGTGAMIGLAGLRNLTLDGTAELEAGYGFLPAWWGQGLATEMASACIEQGFAHLDFPSIVALVHPDNAASRHVLTKLGFQYERTVTAESHTSDLFRIDRAARPPARSGT